MAAEDNTYLEAAGDSGGTVSDEPAMSTADDILGGMAFMQAESKIDKSFVVVTYNPTTRTML